MMFLDGNIAAPPTMTVFSPDIILSCALTGAAMMAVKASAPKAAAERTRNGLDMSGLPVKFAVTGGHPPAMRGQQRRRPVRDRLVSLSGRATRAVRDGF